MRRVVAAVAWSAVVIAVPCRAPAQAKPDGASASLVEAVLPVEKAEDQRGRNQIAVLLARAKVNFIVQGMGPKELCRYLSSLAGDKVTFLFLDRSGTAKVDPIELELKSVNLLSVMSAVQMQTGLQFVYRDGLVLLSPKDQVNPAMTVRVYDLRGAVTPLHNFPGPKLGLRSPTEEAGPLYPPEEESGNTVSGFTAEQIEELIKKHVTPELWGDKATLSNQRGVFLVRTTLAGHRAIALLLDELGVLELPRTVIPAVPPPLPPRRSR
jgi:hypothetical protein